MSEQDKTIELIVQELQNRIGQITSQYETQMAILKAQATVEIENLKSKIDAAGEDKDGK